MKNSQEKNVVNENPQCSIGEKESSYKSSKSTSELSNDNFYDTPEIFYKERPVQQEPLNLGQRNTNNLFYTSQNPLVVTMACMT